MDSDQRDPEDPTGGDASQRKRPRVIDKRVSARSATEPPPDTGTPSAPDPSDAAGDAPPPAAKPPDPEPQPPGGDPAEGPAASEDPSGRVWTPEQEAEAQRVAEEIGRVHGRDWVVSMAMNLANVAGVKIDGGALEEASLAIDALAGIVKETGPRMGDAEQPLRQILSQLQMAYAQASGAVGGPPQP